MAIFNRQYINEAFWAKKKPNGSKKHKPNFSSKMTEEEKNEILEKYTKHDVSGSDNATFNKLYNNEALTAEGMSITPENEDKTLRMVAKWFKTNSGIKDAIDVNIYIILGKAMNDYYHLTGKNQYPDDLHIVCIDWIDAGAKSPYKGIWRWFSDVVDNNAKREISAGNHHYDHYRSIYYGDIGLKDKGSPNYQED